MWMASLVLAHLGLQAPSVSLTPQRLEKRLTQRLMREGWREESLGRNQVAQSLHRPWHHPLGCQVPLSLREA